jgi:hypothetical protein
VDTRKARALAEALHAGLNFRRAAAKAGLGESTARRYRGDPGWPGIVAEVQRKHGAGGGSGVADLLARRVVEVEKRLGELDPASPEHAAVSGELARLVRSLRDASAIKGVEAPATSAPAVPESTNPYLMAAISVMIDGSPEDQEALLELAERVRARRAPRRAERASSTTSPPEAGRADHSDACPDPEPAQSGGVDLEADAPRGVRLGRLA